MMTRSQCRYLQHRCGQQVPRIQDRLKRQRRHLLLTRSQHDEELERAIQEGLDEQDLRVQALKLQAQGFKDSNDKLEARCTAQTSAMPCSGFGKFGIRLNL